MNFSLAHTEAQNEAYVWVTPGPIEKLSPTQSF